MATSLSSPPRFRCCCESFRDSSGTVTDREDAAATSVGDETCCGRIFAQESCACPVLPCCIRYRECWRGLDSSSGSLSDFNPNNPVGCQGSVGPMCRPCLQKDILFRTKVSKVEEALLIKERARLHGSDVRSTPLFQRQYATAFATEASLHPSSTWITERSLHEDGESDQSKTLDEWVMTDAFETLFYTGHEFSDISKRIREGTMYFIRDPPSWMRVIQGQTRHASIQTAFRTLLAALYTFHRTVYWQPTAGFDARHLFRYAWVWLHRICVQRNRQWTVFRPYWAILNAIAPLPVLSTDMFRPGIGCCGMCAHPIHFELDPHVRWRNPDSTKAKTPSSSPDAVSAKAIVFCFECYHDQPELWKYGRDYGYAKYFPPFETWTDGSLAERMDNGCSYHEEKRPCRHPQCARYVCAEQDSGKHGTATEICQTLYCPVCLAPRGCIVCNRPCIRCVEERTEDEVFSVSTVPVVRLESVRVTKNLLWDVDPDIVRSKEVIMRHRNEPSMSALSQPRIERRQPNPSPSAVPSRVYRSVFRLNPELEETVSVEMERVHQQVLSIRRQREAHHLSNQASSARMVYPFPMYTPVLERMNPRQLDIEVMFSLYDDQLIEDVILRFYGNLLWNNLSDTDKRRTHIAHPQFLTHVSVSSINNEGRELRLLTMEGVLNMEEILAADFHVPNYVAAVWYVPYKPSEVHWAMLRVDFEKRHITTYDSLDHRSAKHVVDLFYRFLLFIELPGFDPAQWTSSTSTEIPLQQDSVNCGVFVMAMMRCLLWNLPGHSFSAADIPSIRRRIWYELQHNELLPLFPDPR